MGDLCQYVYLYPLDYHDNVEYSIDLSRPKEVSLFTRPDMVPLILGRIASNLKDLIHGKAKPVLWTLDKEHADATFDIRNVDLHSLSGKRRLPSMLFHELGTFQKYPILQERVQRLFCKGQNTYVLQNPKVL